jgi:hypothetical protein
MAMVVSWRVVTKDLWLFWVMEVLLLQARLQQNIPDGFRISGTTRLQAGGCSSFIRT